MSMRKIDPEYGPPEYYLALSKARARQPEEALRLFKSAWARQLDAEKRKHYADGFLRAMAAIGKLEDAYAAIPNPREAFRILAAETMKRYQRDQLKQLITVHAKKHADDPLLPWYQAEV